MAKVLFGNGVAEIRGSQAGTTYSRNRGGAYTRNRVTPLNPQSSSQQLVRSSMSILTTAWGIDLTQAQRDAWTAFGLAWPTTDVFGASITLTGLQMYVRQNTTLLFAELPSIANAPINLDVEALLSLSAVVDVSDASMDLTFTPDPLGATSFLQIYATPALSPGISYVKNKLRLITTQAAEEVSPVDAAAPWSDVFGSFPVAGQKIVFQARVLNGANGTFSTALQSDTIVVA